MERCVFTGHRQLEKDFNVDALDRAIEDFIQKGVRYFYNGMAQGFDLLAAERVLTMKEKYPQIKLIACIPFYGQERSMNNLDKQRYVHILKKADEQRLISYHYTKFCYMKRNQYMVDESDCMIAYLREKKGGTYNTVLYYEKKKNGEKVFL